MEKAQLVLQDGDKAVIIGEERKEKLGYLPQELPQEDKGKTLYEFFSACDNFFDLTPKELANYSRQFKLEQDFFYRNQPMGSIFHPCRVL